MGNYPSKEDIASNIRKFRIMKNLKQNELAKKLGVSNSSISNWENGLNGPSLENMIDMCKEFDISFSELYGLEPSVSLTHSEQELLSKYRMLDKRGVSTVEAVLDVQYQQSVRRETPEEQLRVLASRLV